MRHVAALLALWLAACAAEDGKRAPEGPRLELVDPLPSARVDFGNVSLGLRRERVVAVRNTGGRPASLELQVQAPFAVEPAAAEVAPGETLPLRFSVEASSPGAHYAQVAVAPHLALLLHARGVTCELESPARLDFGAVELGQRASRSIEFRNVGGGLCELALPRTEGGPFELHAPAATVLVPGARAAVTVRYAPTEPGSDDGLLLQDAAGATHRVELVGTAIEPCVVVEPATVDFGSFGRCAADGVRVLRLANRCEVDRRLFSGHATGDRFWFSFPQDPVVPAGGSSEVNVHFFPTRPGVHEAALHLEFTGGSAVEVPLLAEVTTDISLRTDHYFVERPQPVEVLVVVDDTEAMEPWREERDRLLGFLSLRLQGHDFRLGVTTVSREGTPGCGPAAGGSLLPLDGPEEDRLIGQETPRVASTLLDRVAEAGTCQAPAGAAGFAAAWEALDALPGRENALLALYFFAAAPDTGEEPLDTWVERFAPLQGEELLPPTFRLWVQAWTPRFCSGGGEPHPADVYGQLAERLGGHPDSLCSSAPVLPLPTAPIRATWLLRAIPVDRTGDGAVTSDDFVVAVDGEVLPPFDRATGEPVWEYQDFPPAIRFVGHRRPTPGGRLDVTFEPACTGQ